MAASAFMGLDSSGSVIVLDPAIPNPFGSSG